MFLWWTQPILQSVVAAIMWRRKLHRQFPVFFCFLVAQVLNFAVTYPLYHLASNQWSFWYRWYFWCYWTGEAINAVLGFKVIHEIFLDVFRPYHALKDLGTPIFQWAGAVMLLVSVVVAASNSFGQDPVVHAITTLERAVLMVQFGLILFLIVFSRFLGVSRRQTSFGVALGFGVFAGTELMLLAMQAGGLIGRTSHATYDMVNMLAYNTAVVIWFTYSLLPKVSRDPRANYLQTQRWEKGLADLQQAPPSNSLIPMFEGMVERAFSRSASTEAGDELPFPSPPAATRVKSVAAGSKVHR